MIQSPDDPWSLGARAWPGLDLPRATLTAWRDARPAANPAHAVDHFLASACLARCEGAVAAFSALHLRRVECFLGSLASSPDQVDEVRQRLAVRLLVGEDERGPRLAEYAGQGSLEGWVRVVATRVALQLVRSERRLRPMDVGGERFVDPHDSELVYLRQRYRGHFRSALEHALTSLDPTHRMLLRLHFVERMTTAAMALLHRVSRATLVRRIGDAKEALRQGVTEELARTLHLSRSDHAELMLSLQSVLDVSIVRLLAES